MSWPTQQLGELCEFKGGLWTGKKPPFTKAKVLRITNFTKGCELDVTDAIELDVEERQLQSRRLVDGDIIIEKSGGGPNQPVGRVALCADLDGVYSFSNFTTALRINDRRKIEPKFLHQYLKTLYFRGDTEAMQSNSTNLRNLNLDAYRAIEVPIPPLPEQQRIVGKLDAAFAALTEAQAHVERNRANARELFESYLNGVFEGKGEWVKRPLHEIIHVKHGFAFLGEHFTNAGKHVLLTMGNFFEKGGYRDRGEKQKFYSGPVPDDFVLSEGDLVIAMTEQAAGLLGAPLLVPESGKFLHNQRIGLVQQPNGPVVLNEFLFHIFNTKTFRDAVHASGSGVKVRHTSPTKIGDVEVSYPASLKEQQRIVDRLAELEQETRQLETTYQQKLSELAGLKKAVLGAAFRGEL